MLLDQYSTLPVGPQWRFREVSRSDPQVTTAATALPVDLGTVKLHSRIGGTAEDSLIAEYISQAVEDVQFDAEIKLMPQTLTLYLDAFPAWAIELRTPPVQSINSVKYLDYSGTQQTWSSSYYRLDSHSRPGVVTPNFALVWPVTYAVTNAVEIEFVAGYTSADLVPQSAKQAIYLKVSSYYRQREMSAQETDSYERLIDKLRWRKIV